MISQQIHQHQQSGLIQAEFLSTTVPLSLSNPQINITDEIH